MGPTLHTSCATPHLPSISFTFSRPIRPVVMSQRSQTRSSSPSFPSENGLVGYNCSTCGQFAKFRYCRSNTNGNRGRLMATCHFTNEHGESCNFFRWAPGSTKSPSASPSTLSASTLPPIAPSTTALSHVPTIISSGSTPTRCSVQGCGQTRIADECLRRICRKHCIEQGGCTAKTHRTAQGPPLMLPPIRSDATPTTASMLSSDTVDSTPLQPRAAPAAVLSAPQPLDARPDPRFASHLLPIYVESLAREQSLELAKSNPTLLPTHPFHSSTFSDNKAIWRKAPQALKSHYLCAGRRQAGIWSKFVAEVKGLEKAQVSSSSEVIELSE